MSRLGWRTIFTVLLLLYFLAAVLPVSAMFPLPQTDKDEARDFLKKGSRQTDLFLLDFVQWKILKQTRHSDDAVRLMKGTVESNELSPANASGPMSGIASGIFNISRSFPRTILYCDKGNSTVHGFTHFVHSGLAPPTLL